MSKFRSVTVPVSATGDFLPNIDRTAAVVQTPAPESKLLGVSARVLDFRRYQQEIEIPTEMRKITISPDSNPEIFNSFLEKRQILVHFEGSHPDECKATFGLALTESALSAYEADSLRTDCSLVAENTWKFSIATSVSQGVWEWGASHLQSVTLYTNTNLPMMVSTVDSIQSIEAKATTPEGAPSGIPLAR